MTKKKMYSRIRQLHHTHKPLGEHSPGFALVELLVTITLISAGMAVVVQAIDVCLYSSYFSIDHALASRLLEETLLQGAHSPGQNDSGQFEEPWERFRWKVNYNAVKDSPFLQVTASVEWTRRNKVKTLTGERLCRRP